jgi:hypothetical protein
MYERLFSACKAQNLITSFLHAAKLHRGEA